MRGKKEPKHKVRFVTAASLFDGHDASINIMRRILQSEGAEVIHLGHDRSVQEIVDAAVQEDAHGVAISSYQGGHMEFFSFLVEQLRVSGRPDIRVFGGGGGTITDSEISVLHERHGVARIYSVEDGRRMGLVGMIRDMMDRARRDLDRWVSGAERGLPGAQPGRGGRVSPRARPSTPRAADLAMPPPTQLATMRAALRPTPASKLPRYSASRASAARASPR